MTAATPATALAAAVRRLMDAAVLSDVDAAEITAVTADVERLAGRLGARSRDTLPPPDVDGMRRGHRPYSPVVGEANPIAPPMTVRMLPDRTVVGEATLRPIHEGPPGAVHGGWVAALLDQLLGHANAAAGVVGMTAELTVRYRRRTPHGVPLTLRARTDAVDGRRVHCSGEIAVDGVVTAEASGLFLQPSADRVRELARELEQRRVVGD